MQLAESLGTFSPPSDAYSAGAATPDGGVALTNLETFLSNIIGFLTILGGIFFIVYFLIGGLTWVTSGGDSGKVGKARNQMIQGVIGLVVIVAAYSIIGIVGNIVGLNLLTPAASLRTLIP